MTEKKLSDYLHFYLGCQVMDLYNNKVGKLVGVTDKEVFVLHNTQWGVAFDEVKPILRRLSSMTEKEKIEIYNELYPGVETTDAYKAHTIDAQISHQGMYWEGKVSILDYVEWFPVLIKRGYWLWDESWFTEGLIIDADTVK